MRLLRTFVVAAIVLAMIFALALAKPQTANFAHNEKEVKLDEKGQIDKNSEGVKSVLTANNLAPEVSYRCGIFFAGRKVKDKPSEKLFILPKRFPVNRTLGDDDGKIFEPKVYTNDVCPIKDPYGADRWYGGSAQNATCFFIFRHVVRKMKLEHDSFDNEGKSIGDEMCKKVVDLGIQRLPPNKRFKKGIEIGFYFNQCLDRKWYDTSLRMPQRLCCDPTEGKDNPTYRSCDEFDDKFQVIS